LSLCRAPRRILLASGCHTPNRIPDVIGNQQGTGLVDGQPDRPSAGFSSEFRKPVTTSSALRLGRPPLNGTKTTL
jgi:hypothetical protein